MLGAKPGSSEPCFGGLRSLESLGHEPSYGGGIHSPDQLSDVGHPFVLVQRNELGLEVCQWFDPGSFGQVLQVLNRRLEGFHDLVAKRETAHEFHGIFNVELKADSIEARCREDHTV